MNGKRRLAICVLCGLLAAYPARAEVVEEIVAWVNGDIISKSELDQEEQMLLAEVYRRFTGAELDAQVQKARAELLDRMIDRKILLQRASRMWDLQKMQSALLEQFKERQKVKSDAELERLVAQDGMTLDELKQRLVEMYAPEELIRFEVFGRLSVSDKEVASYYEEHPELSEVPARATLREIVLLAEGGDRDARRAEAEGIRERVTTPGADFAAMAREVSQAGTKANGGLLENVGRGDLAPELEQAAFATPVGGVSAAIDLPHGFHILKVEERSEATRKSLEDLKEKIRFDLEQGKYGRALEDYMKKARTESVIVVNDKYKTRLSASASNEPSAARD